jgi:UDP-N-acetylglucosamine/UDP-N-acetylgalactosamine diphosphorylase
MPSYDQILARFTAAAQEHALLFYPELSELERVALLKALDNIDVERCNSIFAKSTKPSQIDAIMSPLPASSFDSIINSNNGKVEKWNAAGMKLIAENKVAVILLAGGQGTRLGNYLYFQSFLLMKFSLLIFNKCSLYRKQCSQRLL